ncbi:MAG: site-specific integrase, partial [Burkholderiaceae bacterium]|nr:site-specific integrase [Burkholderiaceae bacterium]
MSTDPSTPPNYVAQWLAFLANQRRYSPHTVAAYERDMQHLHAFINSLPKALTATPIEQVGPHHIRQCLAKLHAQGHQPRSLARRLAAWRSFFEWLVPRINLTVNPAADIKA